MSNPSVGDKARYAAERVMEPILRRWFEIDLEPVNLDSNAENAAVDLSWALESAGLLLPIVIEGEAPTRKDGDDEATSEEPPPRAPRAEREALERIAKDGCGFWPDACADVDRPEDDWCWACIARDALAGLPAPVPEGVPEDHRVCSHGIYHHGCPSCDRQDPEDRE